MRHLFQALRRIRRAPLLPGLVVVCLSAGTAGATMAFVIVNGILFRPMPFDQPEQLIGLSLISGTGSADFSADQYRRIRDAASSSAEIAARTLTPTFVVIGGERVEAEAEVVSRNYFEILRSNLLLGRTLSAHQSGLQVIVGEGLWRGRMGASKGVLGSPIVVGSRTATVIGIAPRSFGGALQMTNLDLWLPLDAPEPSPGQGAGARGYGGLGLLGRLRGAATAAVVEAVATAAIAPATADPGQSAGDRVLAAPARGIGLPPSYRQALAAVLMVLTMLVLLVVFACLSNAAGILLLRLVDRQREVAIKLSIGATRWVVARELLAEALIVGTGACAVALILIAVGIRTVRRSIGSNPVFGSMAEQLSVDWALVAIAFAVAIALACVASLAPLLSYSANRPLELLKSGASSLDPRSLSTLRRLAGVQIALAIFPVSLALYLYGGLGLDGTQSVAENVVVLRLRPARADDRQLIGNLRSAMERELHLPSGTSVASESAPLLRPPREQVTIDTSGRPMLTAGRMRVSPNYLTLFDVQLLAGAAFDLDSGATGILVNEAFVKAAGVPHPVGIRVHSRENQIDTIIGVVSDVRPGATETPTIYGLATWHETRDRFILLRTQESAERVRELADRELQRQQSQASVAQVSRLSEMDVTGMARTRLVRIVAATALVGVCISICGVFTVVGHGVSRRFRELAIRRALGAGSTSIAGVVLRDAIVMTGIGGAGGALAALAGSQLLRYVVVTHGSWGPMTIALVTISIAAITLVATVVPIHRALAASPSNLLRAE